MGKAAAVELSRGEDGLPIGSHVERFVIRKKLGRGGMGIVYAAHDPRLDRQVALKLVRPEARIGRDESVKRLLREARAAGRLNHPNVATVYDCGVFNGEIYIAMELVDGMTLWQWRQADNPSVGAVVDASLGAARALAAAHASGLIHRDVKPANILITRNGVAKVVDFGLARTTAGPSEPGVPSAEIPLEALTDHRALLGTPGYMAPEYFDRREVTPAIDQFAFCVTLYELLYGEKPYGRTEGRSSREQMRAGHVRPPPLGSRVPTAYRNVLLRGLAPDPSDRFPSMDALVTALVRARGRKRRRLVVAVLASTAIASVFIGGLVQREAAPSCADESEEAAEKLRAQLDDGLAQLGAIDPATGEPARARIAEIAEAWPDRWLAARRTACAEDAEASTAERQLKLACLDTKRREAGVLFDALLTTDTAAARFLSTADFPMPRTADCADATALISIPPVVADPAERAAVERVLARADDVAANLALGRVAVATRDAETLAERVREIGHAPTQAKVEHLLGRLDAASDDPGRAIATFRRGIAAAERGRTTALRVQLWLDLGRAYARAGQTDGASVAADAAEAGMGTLAERERFRVELQLLRAEVAGANDDKERAAAFLKQALDWDLSSAERERALFTLGEVTYGLETARVAAQWHRDALALREATYGPDHPLVAESLSALGRILKSIEPATAVAPLQRALAIQERTYGSNGVPVAFTLERLAIVYTRLDQAARAVTLLNRATSILSAKTGPAEPEAALVWSRLGSALSALGRHDEALAAHQESYDRLVAALGDRHPRLALPAMNYAHAAKRAGRPRAAAAWFDRAVRLLPQRESRVQQQAALRFELARMLWEAGDDQQRALTEARAALTAFPSDKDEYDGVTRGAIEAWLERHRLPGPTSSPRSPEETEL